MHRWQSEPLMDRKEVEMWLSLSSSSLSVSLDLSIYLPIYLSTYLPIYLSTYLPTYLPIYLSIYLHTYARDAKFSDTSCLWLSGNVENCVFAVVICTFLSTVYCLENYMFDGRCFFCPFKFKYKMHSLCIGASILELICVFCFKLQSYVATRFWGFLSACQRASMFLMLRFGSSLALVLDATLWKFSCTL